ncbi:MAG: hypothetical protein AB4057_01210 [Crocosphaera sp.]
MSVYVIGVGGTGAKFVEAVSHLAVAGLYSQGDRTPEIKVLLVDPDKGNGNVKEADTSLKVAQNCLGTIDKGINTELNWWMQTEISLFEGGLWSPFTKQDEFRLRDAFGYDDYNESKKNIQNLFDVLYTPDERDLDLKEGFRGRPAIGAAIMSQLSQDEKAKDNWKKLVEDIYSDSQSDPENPPKVFLCGSIFGGTGASGFPTLGRLIANELENNQRGNLLGTVKLGGLLMLPYFRFRDPGQENQEEIYARAEEFILKTEAALRYYGSQDLKFDAVYLLGMPTMTTVDSFSTGGQNQRNQPHVLELYAAMALRDFLFGEQTDTNQVLWCHRKQQNFINWEDVPERDESRKKLVDAARFAYTWLSVIVPDLEHAKNKLREVHFAQRFYNRDTIKNPQEWDKINHIKDWSEAYLKWLGILHENENGLNWFNTDTFYDKGRLKLDPTKFPHIVEQEKDPEINRLLVRLKKQNLQGNKEGTTGLAKALYSVLSDKSI